MKCVVQHAVRLKSRCKPYRRMAVCPVCRRFGPVNGARIEIQLHGQRWPVCPGCTAEWREADPKRRAEMQAVAQRNVSRWAGSGHGLAPAPQAFVTGDSGRAIER